MLKNAEKESARYTTLSIFLQYATRKITFIDSRSLEGENVIIYTGGEVWFTMIRW